MSRLGAMLSISNSRKTRSAQLTSPAAIQLQAACCSKNLQTLKQLSQIQSLLRKAPDAVKEVDGVGSLPLHHACNHCSPLPVIRELAEAFPGAANVVNADGRIPLHIACLRSAPLRVIQCLIQTSPVSVSVAAGCGYLPLHYACHSACPLEVILELVAACPRSVDTTNLEGQLPLHAACLGGASFEVIRFLVEQSPESVHRANIHGLLPLHWACGNKLPLNVIRFLAEKSPESLVSKAGKHGGGWLPLQVACSCKAPLDVIRFLAEAAPIAVVAEADVKGVSPLAHAKREKMADIVAVLQDVIEVKGKERQDEERELQPARSLHSACIGRASFHVIKFLVEKSPESVNAANKDGVLPLHWACATKMPLTVIKYLVEKSPESLVRIIDKHRWLSLHVACFCKAPLEVIRFLAQASPIAVIAEDINGISPLAHAKQEKMYDTFTVLQDVMEVQGKKRQGDQRAACLNQSQSLVRRPCNMNCTSTDDVLAGATPVERLMLNQLDSVHKRIDEFKEKNSYRLDDVEGVDWLKTTRSVVLVGVLGPQREGIISIGSGFVIDSELGLIVTAAHTLFHMANCNQDQFGTLRGSYRVAIGVIPDGGNSAQFQFLADVVAHDCDSVDACVLRISAGIAQDSSVGEDTQLRAQSFTPLDNFSLARETLQSLEMTEQCEMEARVRIVGFDQGGEGLFKPGTHICPAVDVSLTGSICRLFCSTDVAVLGDQRIGSARLRPKKEIVVGGCVTTDGQSGGPCINNKGQVVGILSRGHGDRSYIVPASEITPLMYDAMALAKVIQTS